MTCLFCDGRLKPINGWTNVQECVSCGKRSLIQFDTRHPRLDDTTTYCHASRDGDCYWSGCPQELDGEPTKTGRHCPYDQENE